MRARRQALDDARLHPTTHAGLWWDKYLADQHDQNEVRGYGPRDAETSDVQARARHIADVCRRAVPPGYRQAVTRQRLGFELEAGTRCYQASADGRLVIGIGEKGALEVGLRLHHTWGTPYLPGSALKGVAAAAAHTMEDEGWHKHGPNGAPGRYHQFLFGATASDEEGTQAGAVVFHDALWLPDDDAESLPLHPDVMTVHHRDYYGGGGAPPTDTAQPVPVAFASATGRYLVALTARPGLWGNSAQEEAARDDWLARAARCLEIGLRDLGIGAKTNAGYGRMTLDPLEASAEAKRARGALAASTGPIQALTEALADGNWRAKLEAVETMLDDLVGLSGEQRKAARTLIRKAVKPNKRTKERLGAIFEALGKSDT